MKKILALLALLLTSIDGKTQTFVNGGIFTNTVWTQASSPYVVTGTVVVFPGVTLTIQPGVVIKFDPNTCLEVRGKCEAIGTINDTIVFTSNVASPSPGAWYGIRLIGTSTPSITNQLTMNYCKGMYADRFVDLDIAYYGPYNFKNCYFSYNNQVNYDGGLPTINFDSCHFVSNHIGLDSPQFGGRVSHSYFLNNFIGTNAFDRVDSCYFAQNTGTACITYGPTVGNKIINNNVAVHGMYNSVNNTFRNNEVTNNAMGVEIITYFNGSITFTGNTICNNTLYDVRMWTNNNADLANNCWCTTNTTQIKSKIYDGEDNASVGLVNVSPIASSCNTIVMGTQEKEFFSSSTLFPNPFDHTAYIVLDNENSSASELIIRDIQGRILRKEVLNGQNKITLQRNELENGLYFFELRKDSHIIMKGKFMISGS